jgi:hypothetical protein
MKNPYILVDMDGTLSNGSARLHHITTKPKNWKAFFKEGANDPVYPLVETIVRDHSSFGDLIIIFTARPESNREITEGWLIEKDIPYHKVMMRKNGDYRPDYIVKEEMLMEVMTEFDYSPMFALDDKHEVLEMFRKHYVRVIDAKILNEVS